MKFQPLDPIVPIHNQLNETLSSIVLINVFTVAPGNVDQLLKAWENDANWMKKQPGYISTQLHRCIAGSCVFLNFAVWESVAQPHLFTRVAVPNLCTN